MGGVAWTEEEDLRLRKCIEQYGERMWHRVSLLAGLNRCRKSCRLRWLNYLRPNIKRGSFTKEEVDLIFNLHNILGNRWSSIASRLPGRTANDVKNFWNCHLSKRLLHSHSQNNNNNNSNNNINDDQEVKPITRNQQDGLSPPPPFLYVEDGKHHHHQQQQQQQMFPNYTCLNNGEENNGCCNSILGELLLPMDNINYDHFEFFAEFKVTGSEEIENKWDWDDDLFLDLDLWS